MLELRRGTIKIFEKNKLTVLTEHSGEETLDQFTFDELQKFIKDNSPKESLKE